VTSRHPTAARPDDLDIEDTLSSDELGESVFTSEVDWPGSAVVSAESRGVPTGDEIVTMAGASMPKDSIGDAMALPGSTIGLWVPVSGVTG
jgi:hypothetical protein